MAQIITVPFKYSLAKKFNNIFDTDNNHMSDSGSIDTRYLPGTLGWYSLHDFGGQVGNSRDTVRLNQQKLIEAIKSIDNMGGGVLIIPPGMSYGFGLRQSYNLCDKEQEATTSVYPDLSKAVNDFLIIDNSPAIADHNDGPIVGSVLRMFFHTGNPKAGSTEIGGLHSGNQFVIHGRWHPSITISNDLDESDLDQVPDPDNKVYNRQASLFFAAKGWPLWEVGQCSRGRKPEEDSTEDYLTDFVITGQRFPRISCLADTMFTIARDTGFMGLGSGCSHPSYEMHVTLGGFSRFGKYYIDKYTNGDRVFCIECMQADNNVNLLLKGTFLPKDNHGNPQKDNNGNSIKEVKERFLGLQVNTGDFYITDDTGKSRAFVLNPSGNAFFEKGVSGNAFKSSERPTSVTIGTMIFDTSLTPARPIWYKGDGEWVDANGLKV